MSSRLRRNSGDIAFVLGLSAVGWSHWLDMHHLASAVAVAALVLGWYSGRSKLTEQERPPMTDSPYGDGPFVVARSDEPMGDGQPVSVAGKPILFTDHGNAEPVAYAMITAESAETGKEFSEVDQHWQVRSQHQQQEVAAVGDADDSWWQQASFAAGSMHSVMESIETTVYELGQDIPDEKIYADARAEYEKQATDALTGLRQQHQQVGDALDRLDKLIASDKQ